MGGRKSVHWLSEQDEPEPSAKQTFGPFTADLTWNDFWINVLPFLSSWDLWKLSCSSKPLFTLTWNILIPIFEGGLRFGEACDLEVISKYLNRVKTLKVVGLSHTNMKIQMSQFTILSNLANLSSLKFPGGRIKDTPWKHFSHLTSLTDITFHDWFDEGLPEPFLWFPLKKLTFRIDDAGSGPLVPWSQLTLLEDLVVSCDKNLGDLSCLTRLKSLKIICHVETQEEVEIDLEDLTQLTRLSVNPPPRGISKLTNLQYLAYASGPPKALVDLIANLKHLKKFKFRPEWCTADKLFQTTIENLSILQDLRTLKIDNKFLSLGCFSGLENLHTLKLYGRENKPIPLSDDDFKNLTYLDFWGENMKIVSKIPNLKILDFHPKGEWKTLDFSPVKNLSNLETLSCRSYTGGLGDGTHFNPQGLSDIPTNLKTFLFYPGGCKLLKTDDFIEKLVHLTGLKELSVSNTDLTPKGIKTISENFLQLQKLDLSETGMFECFKYNWEGTYIDGKPLWYREKMLPKITKSEFQEITKPLFQLTKLERLHLYPHVERQFWCDQMEYQREQNSRNSKPLFNFFL